MDNNDVINKLKKMRLPIMAEQYEIQIQDPHYDQLSFTLRSSHNISGQP